MEDDEMTIYKQHKITQTNIRHAETLRPLYAIDGRYTKPAAHRPFITSLRDAREWINEQIAADEAA